MKKTIRIGAALSVALATTGAYAADASARDATLTGAQRCDTRGYDAEAMQARDPGCAPVSAAPASPGGYDPIAMYAVHGERPRRASGRGETPGEPDALTLAAWSGP